MGQTIDMLMCNQHLISDKQNCNEIDISVNF